MMQHTLDISSVDTPYLVYLLYLLYLHSTPPLMQDTLGTQCPNRAFPDVTRVMNESLVQICRYVNRTKVVDNNVIVSVDI